MINYQFNNNKSLEFFDNEFDIKLIFKTINRNKKTILKFSLIFFILACVFSLIKKRTWEGQFEIVLNNENPQNQFLPSKVQLFLENSGNQNNLKTEVGILESPSVLMPIFEYLKSTDLYSKKQNYSFSNWKKNNLDIELKKSTSILKIAYRDKDKKEIINVLKKISDAYQNYSIKNKKSAQLSAVNYLNEQIDIFKDKSSNSLRSAQEFAIDQDLNLLSNNKSFPNLELKNLEIEIIRVNAANELRKIDLQIKKIKNLENFNEIKYLAYTIPALVEEGLPETLKKIELELLDARIKYAEKDKVIVKILKKRDLLISLLKERGIGNLNAKKLLLEATMQAAMRPKGVLLEYKELIRNAARNEETLINLENKLSSVNLEMAKKDPPWELITNPTLNQEPYAPKRRRYGFLGLLSGFVFGSIYSIYKERKSGKILDFEILENIFSAPILETINTSENEIEKNKAAFLKIIISNIGNELNIFTTGSLNQNDLQFIKKLKSDLKSNKINLILNNINDIEKEFKCDRSIIIALESEKINYKEISILKKKIFLLQSKVEGILIFNK